jgi:predicted transcriptional regulator
MAKGKKASLVQCRIEACQTIDQIAKLKDLTIKDAMMQLAGEEGVPYTTLKFWYYRDSESKKSGSKVTPPQLPRSTPQTKAKVAARIVKNFAKAIKKEEEDALAAQANRDGAHALAQEMGGAFLAEELYELFLKKMTELDEIVSANKELSEPMDSTKVIDQLLRAARNSGWEEPVVEEVESNTCNKCKVTSCPNRACDNHKPKKKGGK